MRLLGPSIEDVFQLVNEYVSTNHKKFSTSTCCVLAVLMLQIVKSLHEHGFLHRDIKPANFLMGLDSAQNELRMIDFGLTTYWRDPTTKEHVAYGQSDDVSLIGTPRFASINSHNGVVLSRRDDLESISYTLIYFLKGTLPWWEVDSNPRMGRDELLDQIRKKKCTAPSIWCKNIPIEFVDFVNYVRRLGYDEEPDYDHWVSVFRNLCSATLGTSVTDITEVKCDWHWK
ncbi:hypothetical protein GEMRC1_013104 [Eukaryota sp. GEM-RC1]